MQDAFCLRTWSLKGEPSLINPGFTFHLGNLRPENLLCLCGMEAILFHRVFVKIKRITKDYTYDKANIQ